MMDTSSDKRLSSPEEYFETGKLSFKILQLRLMSLNCLFFYRNPVDLSKLSP